MRLDPEDLEELKAAITSAALSHECRFAAIRDADVTEVSHAVGMVRDLGKGDFRAGIEIIRDHNRILSGMVNGFNRAAWVVGGVVLSSVALGLVGGAVLMVRTWVRLQGTNP